AVEAAVRLPAVHDPRLDLQLVTGEDLDPDAIEEPGSVRGDVGGLVGPVVELVVAEETDVGEEDAGVDVEAVQDVEVIPAIALRDVAEGIGKVPLSAAGAGIVPRSGLRIHSDLGHQPASYVLPVEVTAHAEHGELDLARPEDLARTGDGVVGRMSEVVVEAGVHPELEGEDGGVER